MILQVLDHGMLKKVFYTINCINQCMILSVMQGFIQKSRFGLVP